MRQTLFDYNKFLANIHIDIETLDLPVLEVGYGKKKMKLQINQQDKFVRRIFNNSRWDQGGRFYGGWWQRCPREYRKRIVFDHILTAELDFSGLHIVILYAQQGINYWAEINEDPYLIPRPEGVDLKIDIRETAKVLFLTAINADNEKETFRAFRRQSKKGSLEKRLTNSQLSIILNSLKQRHKPIATSLASGSGIKLMYVDSQITEILIKRFTYHYKCPILTIHDSYIVPFGYDYILKEEMEQAFETVTGFSDPVIKHTTDYYNIREQEVDEEGFIPPTQRHLAEVELFRSFKGKPTREDWVSDRTMFY
jgi:hypothetical protein